MSIKLNTKLIKFILLLLTITITSCDRILLSKDYEVLFRNGERDTLEAVKTYNVGDGYLGFTGKDGTTVGMYKLDEIKNVKVIEYNEVYRKYE